MKPLHTTGFVSKHGTAIQKIVNVGNKLAIFT
jgi:hypothetical protein